MLFKAVRLDRQATLVPLGPGALAPVSEGSRASPLMSARLEVPLRTRVVVLGDEFLLAARRWPWVVLDLHARMLEQSERLTARVAICQLPRVEQRLHAMMWLLADTWDHVTPDGITLDLSLTHQMLGEFVGARRPTVTLALRALAERKAVIKQGARWLILDPPEIAEGAEPMTERALAQAR